MDPQSGIVRTRRSLDYERQAQCVIIGILENMEVNVQVFKYLFDNKSKSLNIFLVLSRTEMMRLLSTAPCRVRLRSTVPVGQIVITIIAVDFNNMSPNNQVLLHISKLITFG